MKSKNPDKSLSNFIMIFQGNDVYLGNCSGVLKKYKMGLRKLVKKSMYYRYLNGESAIPIRLVIQISKNNPKVLDECFGACTFASRANKPHKLPRKVDSQLAYLVGCLRDSYIDSSRYSIAVSQYGKGSKEWLKHLQKIFHEEFGIKGKVEKFRDGFILKAYSKPMVIFLQEIFQIPGKQENWDTPKIIEENRELWIPYISGFFDAEGYATKPETFKKTGKKKIGLFQTNKKSLEFIKKALSEFDIGSSKIYLETGRKCFALYIQSKDDILKFAKLFKPVRKNDQVVSLSNALETP